MLKNINISSGSDFSKKKFGTITQLTKPTFMHNGRVFSDNTVKNQKIIPLIKDNIYYVDHGLPDEYQIYEYIYTSFFIDPSIQNLFIQSIINNTNSIEIRNILSQYRSEISQSSGASFSSPSNLSSSTDPYDNNPPPQCNIP